MGRNKKRFWKKAQSTAEYVTLFAFIVGSIIAMQVYLKRSAQARLAQGMKDATGTLITNMGFDMPYQYEPYYESGYEEVFTQQNQTSKVKNKGAYTGTTIYNSNITNDATEITAGNDEWLKVKGD